MTTPDIPTEALEAAARAYCLYRYNYAPDAYAGQGARERHITNDTASTAEEDWLRVTLTAAAPHLIAEGRRQRDQELFVGAIEPEGNVEDETPRTMSRLEREVRAKVAAELLAYAENYPEDVFRADGTSTDAIAGTAMRHAYRNAAVIAEEGRGGD